MPTPPPKIVSRGVCVMPCTRAGSSWISPHQASVGSPLNEATVQALLAAIEALSRGAPSIRAAITGSPDTSATHTHTSRPIDSAWAIAVSSARRAAGNETDEDGTRSAMPHP